MTRLVRFLVLRLGPLFLLIFFSKEQSAQVAKQVEGLTDYISIFQQRTEMGQMSRLLRSYFQKLNRPPPDLAQFLDAQYTTERDMRYDVWDQMFRFDNYGRYCKDSQRKKTWYLVSCGPDQKCGTEDDLCQKIN